MAGGVLLIGGHIYGCLCHTRAVAAVQNTSTAPDNQPDDNQGIHTGPVLYRPPLLSRPARCSSPLDFDVGRLLLLLLWSTELRVPLSGTRIGDTNGGNKHNQHIRNQTARSCTNNRHTYTCFFLSLSSLCLLLFPLSMGSGSSCCSGVCQPDGLSDSINSYALHNLTINSISFAVYYKKIEVKQHTTLWHAPLESQWQSGRVERWVDISHQT